MKTTDRQLRGRKGGIALTSALLALAIWLTSRQLRDVDWSEVTSAISNYSGTTVALVLLCTFIGFVCVSQYDLVGRYYTGLSLAVRRAMAISFIGYTFSVNLGALLGGFGSRYRLYSLANIPAGSTTRIIGLSVLGNWCGYTLLAGLLFTLRAPPLPESWIAGQALLPVLGMLMLLACGAYLWLCWRHAGYSRDFGNVTLVVPSLGMAFAQFALSVPSWCANATILYLLLPDNIGWFTVLFALVISSIATILSHVPGGIGVLEWVFISILSDAAPQSQIIAALLAYRCAYFLLPLLLAVCLYIAMEIRSKR